MKEKKLKLKKEIFQLKLKNEENEQTIYDLQETLQPKQSLIENLKLELSQLKYENVWLKDENLSLANHLKYAQENFNQEKQNLKREKNKIKQLEKQEKDVRKTHDNIKQMHDELMSQNSILGSELEELQKYKQKFETFQAYFELQYNNFTKTFPKNFKKISQIETQLKLKNLLCNEDSQYNPDFEYERALIDYGFFKHAEYFRIHNIIQIAEEFIFDPNKLELTTCICSNCDNEYNEKNMHVPKTERFETPKKSADTKK